MTKAFKQGFMDKMAELEKDAAWPKLRLPKVDWALLGRNIRGLFDRDYIPLDGTRLSDHLVSSPLPTTRKEMLAHTFNVTDNGAKPFLKSIRTEPMVVVDEATGRPKVGPWRRTYEEASDRALEGKPSESITVPTGGEAVDYPFWRIPDYLVDEVADRVADMQKPVEAPARKMKPIDTSEPVYGRGPDGQQRREVHTHIPGSRTIVGDIVRTPTTLSDAILNGKILFK